MSSDANHVTILAFSTIAFAIAGACHHPHGGTGDLSMSTITISISPPIERVSHGGPAGVTIEVCNRGGAAVETDLSYPSDRLVIHPGSPGLELRSLPTEENRESAGTQLGPGECVRHVHELQRYIRFPGPGTYAMTLSLTVRAGLGPDGHDHNASTELHVIVETASPDALSREIDRAAAGLTAAEPVRRAEAVEALVHLDTPAVKPRLVEILNVAALAPYHAAAMRALGRLGGDAALAIVDRALTTSDLPTVYVGLQILAAAGHPLSRPSLHAIIAAGEGAQAAVLEHLLIAGGTAFVDEIQPLATSSNPRISALARQVLALARK
jgi:hypothetical protein